MKQKIVTWLLSAFLLASIINNFYQHRKIKEIELQNADLDSDVDKLKKDNSELEDRLSRIGNSAADLQSNIENAKEYLGDLISHLNSPYYNHQVLQKDIYNLDGELEEMEENIPSQ